VRDAAGKLPDGFHFLGLADVLLRGNFRGDVPNKQVVDIATTPAQAGHRYFYLDLLSVLSHCIDFKAFAFDSVRLPQQFVHGEVAGPITLRQVQIRDWYARRFLP
jgi:hypothetical protein